MNMERNLFFGSIGDDRRYTSADLAKWATCFYTTGITPSPATALQVMAAGLFTVSVQAGSCNIKGYIGMNDADTMLEIDMPDGIYNRIDAVVARLNMAERAIQLLVVKGMPDTTPTPPETVRNAQVYDLCLARVLVRRDATLIAAGDITDTRTNASLCGVATAVIPLNTTAVFAQYQAMFDQFMGGVRDTLSEDAAGHLLTLIQTNADLLAALKSGAKKSIQAGSVTVSAAAAGTTEYSFNFPEPFATTPLVFPVIITSAPQSRSVAPLSRTATGATIVIYNALSAASVTVLWLAIS